MNTEMKVRSVQNGMNYSICIQISTVWSPKGCPLNTKSTSMSHITSSEYGANIEGVKVLMIWRLLKFDVTQFEFHDSYQHSAAIRRSTHESTVLYISSSNLSIPGSPRCKPDRFQCTDGKFPVTWEPNECEQFLRSE